VIRLRLSGDKVETAIIFANRKTTVRELNNIIYPAMDFPAAKFMVTWISITPQSTRPLQTGDTGIFWWLPMSHARGLDIKGASHLHYDTPWHSGRLRRSPHWPYRPGRG
jgi:hypothetical protein